jgi:hypothetical protein
MLVKEVLTWEAETGELAVQSQPRQLARPHFRKKLGVVVHAYHPSYGRKQKQDHSPGQPEQKARPYTQNKQRERS